MKPQNVTEGVRKRFSERLWKKQGQQQRTDGKHRVQYRRNPRMRYSSL